MRASASRRLASAPIERTGAAPISGSLAARAVTSANRFNARSVPTNASTNASAGWARIVSGVPNCTSAPSRRIAIRSPILSASSISCVTNTIVFFRSLQDLQELALQMGAGYGVDGAERLVHQHHRRIGGKRARDADALPLSAGERARKAVAISRRVHADQRQQFVHAPRHARLVPFQQARHGGDVVGDRPVRKQPDLLDDVADAAAKLDAIDVHDIAPADRDGPGVGLDHPVDDPHRRRLAAAGRSDEHAQLALGNRQRQVIDGGTHRARKLLGERGDLDHGARIPAGVSAICSQPNRRSAPIDSSVAGIAPTSSCGSAIIAMPAVMKSPSPPPPM